MTSAMTQSHEIDRSRETNETNVLPTKSHQDGDKHSNKIDNDIGDGEETENHGSKDTTTMMTKVVVNAAPSEVQVPEKAELDSHSTNKANNSTTHDDTCNSTLSEENDSNDFSKKEIHIQDSIASEAEPGVSVDDEGNILANGDSSMSYLDEEAVNLSNGKGPRHEGNASSCLDMDNSINNDPTTQREEEEEGHARTFHSQDDSNEQQQPQQMIQQSDDTNETNFVTEEETGVVSSQQPPGLSSSSSSHEQLHRYQQHQLQRRRIHNTEQRSLRRNSNSTPGAVTSTHETVSPTMTTASSSSSSLSTSSTKTPRTSNTTSNNTTTTATTSGNNNNNNNNTSNNNSTLFTTSIQEGWTDIVASYGPVLEEKRLVFEEKIGKPSKRAIHNFFYVKATTADDCAGGDGGGHGGGGLSGSSSGGGGIASSSSRKTRRSKRGGTCIGTDVEGRERRERMNVNGDGDEIALEGSLAMKGVQESSGGGASSSLPPSVSAGGESAGMMRRKKMNDAATTGDSTAHSTTNDNDVEWHDNEDMVEDVEIGRTPRRQNRKSGRIPTDLVGVDEDSSLDPQSLSGPVLSTPPSSRGFPLKELNMEDGARQRCTSLSSASSSSSSSSSSTPPVPTRNGRVGSPPQHDNNHDEQYTTEERRLIEQFWKWYDDIVFLSLFAQLGIIFRVLAASWFSVFDDVFNESSALFTNLPLNCLSCFLMGLICSGDEAMKVVYTRFGGHFPSTWGNGSGASSSPSPPETPTVGGSFHGNKSSHSGVVVDGDTDDYEERDGRPAVGSAHRRRRHNSSNSVSTSSIAEPLGPPVQDPLSAEDELREVQLRALERRIRASPSLVLFPAKKADVDVMEHYFDENITMGGVGSRLVHGTPNERSLYDLELHRQQSYREDDPDEETGGANLEMEGYRSHRSGESSHMEAGEPMTESGCCPSENGSEDRLTTQQTHQRSVSHGETRRNSTINDNPLGENDNSILHQSADAADVVNGYGPRSENGDANNVPQEQHPDIDQIFNDMSANLTRLTRIKIADGWDVGTTAQAMSEDLLLGLRVGFCGALGTFSSWNSDMVNLLRNGHIGHAFVGYILGLQLPIIAYRFGQHVALYIFIWRCRREALQDERRGYGIRINEYDEEDDCSDDEDYEVFDMTSSPVSGGDGVLSPSSRSSNSPRRRQQRARRQKNGRIVDEEATERETPSVRAIATAIFVLAFVMQITSLVFYNQPRQQQFAISLMFSPFGVLARWKLLQLNTWKPGFPLGTFACNMLGCALSGSLGSLLAGNPGPEESIVLVSMISGFGGSLSTIATFVVEILAGIDPIIFKYDGLTYAFLTVFWGLVIGFVSSASKDWADEI